MIFLSNHHIYFNPRSREGSDSKPFISSDHRYRFQSALPRGERRTSDSLLLMLAEFQSALPRGERLIVPGYTLTE